MELDKTINTYNTKIIYILEHIYQDIQDNKKGKITAEKCIKCINRNIVEFLLEEVQEYNASLEKNLKEINNI